MFSYKIYLQINLEDLKTADDILKPRTSRPTSFWLGWNMSKSSWHSIWHICCYENTHWEFWTNCISFLNSMLELGGTLEVTASHGCGSWGPERRSDLFKVTVLWVLMHTYEEMFCQHSCKLKKNQNVFFTGGLGGWEDTMTYCRSHESPNWIHFSWVAQEGMK